MVKDIKPLNIKVTRCVINGQMYDLMDYDEFSKLEGNVSSVAILEKYNNSDIVLPYRGNYSGQQSTPGVYNAGCIDFVLYPEKENIDQYIPTKIIELSNNTAMKDILEKKETMARLDEPWITSPDNITKFTIMDNDHPEMKCLKTALNKKRVDIDKYSARFGENFPNDKRQLKNNSATLNIIKRFCKYMDMEAILTLRDKNKDVPNPMGTEVTISLTDDYISDDEEN